MVTMERYLRSKLAFCTSFVALIQRHLALLFNRIISCFEMCIAKPLLNPYVFKYVRFFKQKIKSSSVL